MLGQEKRKLPQLFSSPQIISAISIRSSFHRSCGVRSLFARTGVNWNGELAITADLIRNPEAMQQGVMGVRQLIAALPARGCERFGILVMGEHLVDLSGKIQRTEDPSKKHGPVSLAVNESAQPTLFDGHDWSKRLQSFENAVNACRGRIDVQKPVSVVSGSGPSEVT